MSEDHTSTAETPRESTQHYDDVQPAVVNSVNITVGTLVPNSDTCIDHKQTQTGYDPIAEPCAQIDTGAYASCTDQLHLLWHYREFNDDYRCPICLIPATEGSDASPLGVGYLRVPAPGIPGYVEVRTFYSPALRTTVIDERDLIRAAGHQPKDFTGQVLEKNTDANTWTYHARHRRRRTGDVVIHGRLECEKCYTFPLIPPPMSGDDARADANTSPDIMAAKDPQFAHDCLRATVYNVTTFYEDSAAVLKEELKKLPQCFQDSGTPDLPGSTSIPWYTILKENVPVQSIKADTERMLWHQRLGHPSDAYLYNAHRHMKGVPRFKHHDPILEKCPTCIQAKQTKEPPGENSTCTATQPYQGLSIDFSFSGLKSKNEDRIKDYVGLNGETSWILITDHFSRRLIGDARLTKGSPIHWLRHFLANCAPVCEGKYVYMDQGGELYRNPEVVALFEGFGYEVRPTGADASNQNGPVERAHLTVANGVRAMLHGANLDGRFWPYAFHHFLRIKNSIPCRTQGMSPIELTEGKQDDFSDFRTFGCRVWVRPPGNRTAKLKPSSRKGIFLGFVPGTTRNIVWYDPGTERVKIAKHARFDEGMNDLPMDAIPPNVTHLQRVQLGEKFKKERKESSVKHFVLHHNPFNDRVVKTCTRTGDDALCGMELAVDPVTNRVYVSAVTDKSDCKQMFSTGKSHNRIIGAFITRIDDSMVFTKDQATDTLNDLLQRDVKTFEIEFAIEPLPTKKQRKKAMGQHDPHSIVFDDGDDGLVIDDDDHVPTISVADIRSIASILHPDCDFSDRQISNEEIGIVINAISSDAITPEEHALGSFTRRKLRKLTTWPKWRAGEHKQLDHFHQLQMYGLPVDRPPGAVVLRPHWNYTLKRDGTRRSRNCCDGSKRAAPLLHAIASTYSSCVEQPVQRLFFALAAHKGYQVFGGDAQDAYAHSPPPEVPTFVTIDDQYADWYETRFNKPLDRTKVLPVMHALQGHPEAGKLWEKHINSILHGPELNFKSTTHDKTIYRTTFKGHLVFLLRQVDDFAVACSEEQIARDVYAIIGEKLRLPNETAPPFKFLGLVRDFNGVEVTQSRDHITLSCRNYINRVLRTHGWETPSRQELEEGALATDTPGTGEGSTDTAPETGEGTTTPAPTAGEGTQLNADPCSRKPQRPTKDPPLTTGPSYPIGTAVKKKWGNTYYRGEIVGYDADAKWYKVRYNDGDEAEYDDDELAAIVISTVDTAPSDATDPGTPADGSDSHELPVWEQPVSTRRRINVLPPDAPESTDDTPPLRPTAPLPIDAVSKIYTEPGPAEHTHEHAELESKFGFSYRSLLGELMYAYVTCRPDIGYAVVALSKYSGYPREVHYSFLKSVAKYLRRTKSWGIRFRKSKSDPRLPASVYDLISHDAKLPDFPSLEPFDLTGFVDAAHANDLRKRRSTTGYAFMLCGAVVAYKSKTQSITATSSTEAEFIAAVAAAKTAKYLRSILSDLGMPPRGPTRLYEDNMAAIQMVNAKRPTERSRHIDIQYFAIQDWKENNDIELAHCPGVLNPADDLTKPLGWVLHSRHARRIMGHYT